MTIVTSRSEFQALTTCRLREAKLLLDAREWDGAYYLAGYAVEFALKACMIARLMKLDSFPHRNMVDDFYKHDLTRLFRTADLEGELKRDAAVAPQWNVVKDWSEQTRYTIGKTEREAVDLYEAIEKGVLPWIMSRW